MPFSHYIQQGGKLMRCGYTTGTCAALASKAAVRMLLTGARMEAASILTPKGLSVEVELRDIRLGDGFVSCCVEKDAGDDVDVTAGALIGAKAEKTGSSGVQIEGGSGVGRVTKPGLDQPVGAAAINAVPRRMIEQAVREECRAAGYPGGVRVTVFVPEGERLARKTFNPQLGIVGGISILGTSGIVEPQSVQALIDTIAVELRQRAATGAKAVLLTPGNYGEDFVRSNPALSAFPQVKCSNYIGEAIDLAVAEGFRSILLAGHIGKLVKLAGGIMNTHSRVADCRCELFAAHAALAGAPQAVIGRLMQAATTDACLDILDEAALRGPVLRSLLAAVHRQLVKRAGGDLPIGAVLFSNQHGYLGETPDTAAIVAAFQEGV